jgi:hypothetical protein
MEQIVLDISSAKDATLIKELLKRFKGVEVNCFSASLAGPQMQERIEKGIKDADEGNVKPWKRVKSKLLKRIRPKSK